MKSKWLWLLWCALVLLSTRAEAGLILGGVTNSNTAPTVFNTFGPYQMALNFGGSNLTQNTVPFTGVSVANGTPVSATVATLPYNVTISTSAGQTLNTASLGGNALYETEIWSSNNSPEQILITGLNASPNYLYQFQFLHGDPRALTYNNGTVTFTDSLGNTANQSLTFGPGGGGNEFARLSLQVFGSTSLRYNMPAAGRGPSFSGMTIQVQAVPEPASVAIWSLLGIAGTAVGWRAWKRRRSP